jgi:hypothetical protein
MDYFLGPCALGVYTPNANGNGNKTTSGPIPVGSGNAFTCCDTTTTCCPSTISTTDPCCINTNSFVIGATYIGTPTNKALSGTGTLTSTSLQTCRKLVLDQLTA